MTPDLTRAAPLVAEGYGDRKLSNALGVTRHQARVLLHEFERADRGAIVTPGSAVSLYDTACRALAEAVRVDEIKDIMPVAAALSAYGRRAKNYEIEANGVTLREHAERRLGEILIEAKRTGQLGTGRPPKNGSATEPLSRVTLEEANIDKKLSMRAQRKAGIAAQAFDAMVDRMRDDIVSGRRSNDILKAVTTEQKQKRRDQRESELAGKILALPDKRYGVILADPEWRFEPYSRETGMDRAPENHYSTSTVETIAARPVADIAADDCVLFLWATAPMLREGLHVMESWGFEYKTHAVWDKELDGPGYWFRGRHELILIGTRGNIPAPAPGTQRSSILQSKRTRHSEKPEYAYLMIEHYFPNLPKIELNARRARAGWDCWGLEAPPHDPVTGEIP